MEFCRISELVVSPYLEESSVEISLVTAVFITCFSLELVELFCPHAAQKRAAPAYKVIEASFFFALFAPSYTYNV